MTSPLLDPRPVVPVQFQRLEQAVTALLETRLDVVMPQAEAVVPLEGAARSLGHPGVTALNIGTKPYGVAFGRWLENAGADVIGLEVRGHDAVNPDAVWAALAENPEVSLVSFVHAEAASGVRNDAGAIAALARQHGALIVMDAVASFGADEVHFDDWGIDVGVIGPQKALSGPAGISVATLSEKAWQAMAANPRAPRDSFLSLLDWKERWLDSDKSTIPGTPSPLEILALEAAVERVSAEGLPQLRARHRAAAAASRSGARALGLRPFANDESAAFVATTLTVPDDIDARVLVAQVRAEGPAAISSGVGELARHVVRIDHTGQRARLEVVLEALEAIGAALRGKSRHGGPVPEALAAAEQAWSAVQAGALP